MRSRPDFPSETMKARRQWDYIFKVLKKKTTNDAFSIQ